MDTVHHLQGPVASSSSLTPLFLIHAISGIALPYLSLGALSSSTSPRPIYGLSCPVFGIRPYKLPMSISQAADDYIKTIRHIQPSGPYLVGGWSFGGLVALQIAAKLHEQSERIIRVLLIDTPNPSNRPSWLPQEKRDLARWTFNQIAQRAGKPNIPEGSEPSLELKGRLKKGDQVELFRRMYLHIFNVLGLVEGAAGGGFWRGNEDVKVSLVKCGILDVPAVLEEGSRRFYEQRFNDKGNGWVESEFGELEVLQFQGEHDGVFDEEVVGDLTELVRGVLERTKE